MSETTVVQEFAAPLEQVFAALADQDRMGTWMAAKISVPARGAGGLVGTVRRIHLGPASFDERIEECEAPHFMAYRIVTPLPFLRRHRGELRVEARGPTSTYLHWRIVMEFQPAFLGPLVLGPLKLTMQRGLARLAHSLAS